MDVDISPDPTPEERVAMEQALMQLLEPRSARVAALYESPWRVAGLQENAGDDLASLD